LENFILEQKSISFTTYSENRNKEFDNMGGGGA
jgi:hypothetical protein